MSLDAPLLPPALISDCEPSLGAPGVSNGAVGGRVKSSLDGLWRLTRGEERPSMAGAKGSLYERSKRMMDASLAAMLMLALAPVYLSVAILVKATSPGPVIFRQKRLGRRGRIFWCYKFRTMVADAEEQLKRHAELAKRYQGNFKIRDDPRLTSIGGILRKTSLDELPQLFNVLRGDISLIGPRPIVEPERDKYGEYAEKLLSVKPGLSGMWQVYGRSNTTYEQRVAMDMAYIDERSLWLDLKLIVLTAYVVIRGRETC